MADVKSQIIEQLEQKPISKWTSREREYYFKNVKPKEIDEIDRDYDLTKSEGDHGRWGKIYFDIVK